MANVMIQYNEQKILSLYLAKKDLEEEIIHFEFDLEDKWGGEIHLSGGAIYYLEPLDHRPRIPITVRAKRLQAA